MDIAFRSVMKKELSKDIDPMPYYEEATFSARISKYIAYTTLDHSTPDLSVFSGYADKALANLGSTASK